ncbi:alpha/beta fold hydrolase [Moraxella nonliquefaciens]
MNAILATGSIFKYTRQIIAPTLIIHGNKDGLLHQSHGKHIAKIIPNSQFVGVDGMAHDLPVYYQPYLASLIIRHLSSQV